MCSELVRRSILTVLAWIAMADGAIADGPCAHIEAEISAARNGFPDWKWTRDASILSDADNCSVAQTTSGPVLLCTWSFVYRADAARTLYQSLLNEVASCLGPDTIQRTDPAVNHPDFYELREHLTDGVTVAVSIKDKAALQKTLVFTRVYRTLE